MTFAGAGHHHFHFRIFGGISRKTRLMWLRNAAALMCLMVLVAAMWVGGNLLALIHTPLMSGTSPLDTVTILTCTSTTLSLIGLIGTGLFQLRVEQINAPTT